MSKPSARSTGPALSRREFFRITALAGAGLAISIYLPGCGAKETPTPTATPTTEPPPTSAPKAPTATPAPATPAPAPPASLAPDIYVTLDSDGIVNVHAYRSELGQGIRTAIAMIIAEEMDADWSSVRIDQADADSRFNQLTAGSESVSSQYSILRQAGARVRQLLVAAAAGQWSVDAAACRTEKSSVIGPQDGQRLTYGQLVAPAAALAGGAAGKLTLKDPANFTIINTPVMLYDAPTMVTGGAFYTSDLRLPGMLYATVARCPVFGGKATGYDATRARAVPGVRDVVEIDRGIAVVADSTWAALKGREALQVTWDEGKLATASSQSIRERLLPKPRSGAPDPSIFEALYDIPYEAHATMEPMICVADARADGCEVWAPTQDPRQALSTASQLAKGNVTLHVVPAGGGFGRRNKPDYVEEAVQISQAAGAPVQVFWTREDDIRHDFYHPLSVTQVIVKLDESGRPTAMPAVMSNAMATALPTGYWRSVDQFTTAFARESALDEVAALSGLDPVEMRAGLIPEEGRRVLELAASKAGWGAPMPKGQGRGIAYFATFGVTHVAQVAEVSVDPGGQVRVQRVVCAVDCGQVINPDTVVAQMEGAIAFGLTAALKAGVTIANGRVEQGNFNDYPLLRLDEMPAVEVAIVPGEGRRPTGIGEMGVPPIAPAVANAVFAATGVRVREIPIRLS
jgi:isoquinoline 1-oxidoreductase beta subunit